MEQDQRCRRLNDEEKDAARENLRQAICIVLYGMLLYPEECDVQFTKGPNTTVYFIDVCQKDFGRLMGSRGRNIDALRTLVAAIGGGHDFRAIVQIKNEDKFF